MSGRARALAVAAIAALALPAAAYLPPASALLKRAAQRRVETRAPSLEVKGTLALQGEAAGSAAQLLGTTATGPELTVPATLWVKGPGRCRLELNPPGAPATPARSAAPGAPSRGARALASHASPPNPLAYGVKGARPGAATGLEPLPAARALVEGVCALLGDGPGSTAEVERGLAQRLAAHGVALGEVSLGRMGGRVAWVLGGKALPSATPAAGAPPPAPPAPQAWLDKKTLQPMRLLATLSGAPRDVRLVEPADPGAEGFTTFPKTIEVWSGGALEARLTVAKVTPGAKIPDSAF